jgi:hypothetical protein
MLLQQEPAVSTRVQVPGSARGPNAQGMRGAATEVAFGATGNQDGLALDAKAALRVERAFGASMRARQRLVPFDALGQQGIRIAFGFGLQGSFTSPSRWERRIQASVTESCARRGPFRSRLPRCGARRWWTKLAIARYARGRGIGAVDVRRDPRSRRSHAMLRPVFPGPGCNPKAICLAV